MLDYRLKAHLHTARQRVDMRHVNGPLGCGLIHPHRVLSLR